MVYVLLGNGFEEVEAITAIDYLRRAKISVTTVGIGGREITGGHGIPVLADIEIGQMDLTDLDMIVLPGGLGGVAAISGCEQATQAIRFAWENDKFVAAICAAPTILARLGLLKEHTATCYPSRVAELGSAYRDADVVIDPPYLTARAAGQAGEFALRLIEALRGSEAAEAVAKAVCMRR